MAIFYVLRDGVRAELNDDYPETVQNFLDNGWVREEPSPEEPRPDEEAPTARRTPRAK